MAGTLRDDLLSIPGIEGADMDGDVAAPAGVRVRLSVQADVDAVSKEVQRVLAAHGMRSQLTAPHIEPAAPPPPPGAVEAGRADVVALPVIPEVEEEVGPRALPNPPEPESKPEPLEQTPPEPEIPDPSEQRLPEPEIPVPELFELQPSEPETLAVSAAPGSTATHAQQLESVAVEEGRSGVVVRVRATGGDSIVRHADAIRGGVDAAIVAAVAETTGAGPVRMLGVQETVVEGSLVVTVVVELADGTRRAGSAVSAGGRAYGLARAAWKALTAPG